MKMTNKSYSILLNIIQIYCKITLTKNHNSNREWLITLNINTTEEIFFNYRTVSIDYNINDDNKLMLKMHNVWGCVELSSNVMYTIGI